MALEIINSKYLCEATYKYISIINLFNIKFAINNQFSNIVGLNINIFGPKLAFRIFGKDNTSFIISIEYTNINEICNLQFITKSSNLHIFFKTWLNTIYLNGFRNRDRYGFLFFIILGNYPAIDKEAIFYHEFPAFRVARVIVVGVFYQFIR